MTIEEFISDHRARKTELKQKDDDIDFTNKLVEKLRAENKQLKEEMMGNLDDEIAKQNLKNKYLNEEINKEAPVNKATDTLDLPQSEGIGKRDMGGYEAFEYGGEENSPEKLKETVADLSKKLKQAREELSNRPVAARTEPIKEGSSTEGVVNFPTERESRHITNEQPSDIDFRKIDDSLRR